MTVRISQAFLIAAIAAAATTGAAFAQAGSNQSAGAAASQNIGVARAVAAAEQASGGRAFEADLDHEQGVLAYEIDLVKDGRAMEVFVDAASGRVLRQNQALNLRLPFGQDDLKAAQSAPRTLGQTIAMVEQATKGRVTDIGLEHEGGRHYYEVELAGAQDREVRVDLRSGAITPVIDN